MGVSAYIVLLCEDASHDRFVRTFLSRRNFKHRDIHTPGLPEGSQSGEQWVRSRYPDELRATRSRPQGYLVVVVDADTNTTGDRRSELDRECRKRNISPKNSGDRVIVVVPRRNIETWLEYLDGRDVGESHSYRKRFSASDERRLAHELYRMCHQQQQLREPAPPSLSESCVEYAKLRR